MIRRHSLRSPSRNGRLARSQSVRQLPRIIIDYGRFSPSVHDSRVWYLSNVQPSLYLDTRTTATFAQTPNPTPEAFAIFARTLVANVQQALAPAFAARRSGFTYSFLVVGPDAVSSDKFLSRDPTDFYPGNGDPASQGNFFRSHATSITSAWFSAMWQLVAVELASFSLPIPNAVLTDFESLLYGSAPYRDPFVPFGYWEFAVSDMTVPLVLDMPISPAETLRLYADDRALTALGAYFDAYDADQPSPARFDRSLRNQHPNNHERFDLIRAAQRINYSWAVGQAIFSTAKAVFGTSLIAGEWDLALDSQQFSAYQRPGIASHFGKSSDLAVDLQIVVNYGDASTLGLLPDSNIDVVTYPSTGWQTFRNWLASARQQGPIPPYPPPNLAFTTEALLSEQWQRLSLEIRTRQAWAAARTAPNLPLLPAIQLVGDTLDERRVSIPFMVRYMIRAVELGAIGFWIFAPDWNVIGSVSPASYYELVSKFNKAFRARQPRRNRVYRYVG